jgi:hypothetical protein
MNENSFYNLGLGYTPVHPLFNPFQTKSYSYQSKPIQPIYINQNHSGHLKTNPCFEPNHTYMNTNQIRPDHPKDELDQTKDVTRLDQTNPDTKRRPQRPLCFLLLTRRLNFTSLTCT